VQVVAVGRRGPFEAGHCGEHAGLVVEVGGLHELRPDRARHVDVGEGVLAPGGEVNKLHKSGLCFLRAGVERLPKLAPEGRGQQGGVGLAQHRRKAHRLGMVGEHEEVERPDKPERLAGVRHDRLAASGAVDIRGRERGTKKTGVGREVAVNVHVAEEHPVGEVPEGIGRSDGRLNELSRGHLGIRFGERRARDQSHEGKTSKACHGGSPHRSEAGEVAFADPAHVAHGRAAALLRPTGARRHDHDRDTADCEAYAAFPRAVHRASPPVPSH
jgi:hypothetical protein